MPVDIYIRGTEDPYYRDNIIELNDDLSFLIMQLEMVLFTDNYDCYTTPMLGARLRDLIFSLNFNEAEIRLVIRKQISRYIELANRFDIQVDVRFMRGEVSDIAIVDILVDGKKALGAYVF